LDAETIPSFFIPSNPAARLAFRFFGGYLKLQIEAFGLFYLERSAMELTKAGK
jgi:hypothetical protein